MRRAPAFGAAIAAMLCVGAADAPAWTPATAPNGHYTVATPCSAAEVQALRQVPSTMLPSLPIDPGARVLCRKDELLFMAGEIGVPTLPAGTASLFDYVSDQARADPTAEGNPTTTRLDGRRAFVNRQRDGRALAQTGFVEIDARHVVVLVAGTPASGLSADEQAAAIDRFYGSLRIAR